METQDFDSRDSQVSFECPVFVIAFDLYRMIRVKVIKKSDGYDVLTLPSEDGDVIEDEDDDDLKPLFGDSLLDAKTEDLASWAFDNPFCSFPCISCEDKQNSSEKKNDTKEKSKSTQEVRAILQDFLKSPLISIDLSEYQLIDSNRYYTDFCITHEWPEKGENMELLILTPKVMGELGDGPFVIPKNIYEQLNKEKKI